MQKAGDGGGLCRSSRRRSESVQAPHACGALSEDTLLNAIGATATTDATEALAQAGLLGFGRAAATPASLPNQGKFATGSTLPF